MVNPSDQNVRQDNTMDRASTLPLNLYETETVLKLVNLNSLEGVERLPNESNEPAKSNVAYSRRSYSVWVYWTCMTFGQARDSMHLMEFGFSYDSYYFCLFLFGSSIRKRESRSTDAGKEDNKCKKDIAFFIVLISYDFF